MDDKLKLLEYEINDINDAVSEYVDWDGASESRTQRATRMALRVGEIHEMAMARARREAMTTR